MVSGGHELGLAAPGALHAGDIQSCSTVLPEHVSGGGVLGVGIRRAPVVCALDERAAAADEAMIK